MSGKVAGSTLVSRPCAGIVSWRRLNAAQNARTSPLFAASCAGSAAYTSASTVHFSGTSNATLLGASTNSGDIVTGPDASCTGGLANTNTETLRAANGDLPGPHDPRRFLPGQ
jgi:hypothetical protein